jgi:hypothetical protein
MTGTVAAAGLMCVRDAERVIRDWAELITAQGCASP